MQETVLFGNHVEPHQTMEGGKSKSKDNNAVITCINTSCSLLLDQNVFERMTTLMQNENSNDDEAENVDQELTKSCPLAENKCSRRRKDDWNDQTQETQLQLNVLCQMRCELRKQLPIVNLTDQAKFAGIFIPPPHDLNPAITQLMRTLETLGKDSRGLQKQFAQPQIMQHEPKGDAHAATAVKSILKTENRLKPFKIRKSIAGKAIQKQKSNKASIPSSWLDCNDGDDPQTLEDPKQTTNWTKVALPEDMR